jgi:hypothetical protein
MAAIGQRIPAGVAKHVRMSLEAEACFDADTLDQVKALVLKPKALADDGNEAMSTALLAVLILGLWLLLLLAARTAVPINPGEMVTFRTPINPSALIVAEGRNR